MKRKVVAIFMAFLILAQDGLAFCGFFVAKAPADLFNQKSEVILVRDGNKTVITMSNDYQGEVEDFAMVIPVPKVLREEQIKVVDRGIFDRLDAYSAPRLVEYHDANPCAPQVSYDMLTRSAVAMEAVAEDAESGADEAKNYGVTIEATYTIGEYDILILSAEESGGLKDWLIRNGYRIPEKASDILQAYIRTNTKFFVVKVNLEEKRNSGFDYLRPIQISFESEKFMLPIRLGMVNANGPQDLVVYAFSRKGRIEPVNYRTIKVPSNRKVPLFVQRYFGEFYYDLFHRAYHRESRNAVFLEYAWNVSPMQGVKCDPCVSPPPVFNDFAEAGVDWVTGMNQESQVFFTRLHVRYERDRFPQDLQFQETSNREHFQARYVIHHPAEGNLSCSEGLKYLETLENRRRLEVMELKALAGWTNPNYKDYITEFSGKLKDDKYAPNRNDFLPAVVLPVDGDSGIGRLKWLFPLVVLAGLAWLRPRRKKAEG